MASSHITRFKWFAAFSSLLFATAGSAQTLRFDSVWWRQTIHDAERTGFVLGYFDCPAAPKEVSGTTSEDYVAYVYKHLGSSSTSSNVPSVLLQANLHLHPRPILKGGEEYPEKHGWLDGAWWGDATHGDSDEQAGYVEGYLACEFGHATTSQTRRIVDELNHHFGLEKNEHDKIADVLQPILDRKKRN
jgi:hypothetical protein